MFHIIQESDLESCSLDVSDYSPSYYPGPIFQPTGGYYGVNPISNTEQIVNDYMRSLDTPGQSVRLFCFERAY